MAHQPQPLFSKTVGRRKTAVANLNLVSGTGMINVNGFPVEKFFSGNLRRLQRILKPFRILTQKIVDVNVKIKGGGFQRKSEALQLALVRSLVFTRPKTKNLFRKYSLITRDPRMKERRKYGLKKARKSQQFSKRLLFSIYKYHNYNVVFNHIFCILCLRQQRGFLKSLKR
jgi:small subunit ribosomal protein S9